MATITVSNCRRETDSDSISYAEVVALAEQIGQPSVMYSKQIAHDVHRDGILIPGQTISDIEGMRFNVCHTGNA